MLKMWVSERNTDIDSLVKKSTDFAILTIWILKLRWEKFRRKLMLSFILGRNFSMEHMWPFGGRAHVAIEGSSSFCVYYGIKKLHTEGTM